MIILLIHLLRLIPFLFGGHRQLALENLALRQQLAVYKRTVNRPKLQRSDRLLWVWLSRVWPAWRQALVIVSPATVLRCSDTAFAVTGPRSPGAPRQATRPSTPRSKPWSEEWPRPIRCGVLPESMANSSNSASTSLSAPSPVCSRSAAHPRRRLGARS